MSNEEKSKIDRRTFLRMAAIAIPAPFVLAACANEQTSQPSTTPQSTAAPAVQRKPCVGIRFSEALVPHGGDIPIP